MTQDIRTTSEDLFGSLGVGDLLPARQMIIGEFSPAYNAFKEALLSDFAPATKYEFIQALQLVDLNWAILQTKASADVELSSGTEISIQNQLRQLLNKRADSEYDDLLQLFIDKGGDEDVFEDPIDWDEIDTRVDRILQSLKSENYSERITATNECLEIGISPQLVLSSQLLNNDRYVEHAEKLPELEKRVRQLSAEYRELQNSRPVDVSPVLRD